MPAITSPKMSEQISVRVTVKTKKRMTKVRTKYGKSEAEMSRILIDASLPLAESGQITLSPVS